MFAPASSYCIFRRLPDGQYLRVAETENLQDAQFQWMLLEAEAPGTYAVYNTYSGKRVESFPWVAYPC